VEATNSGQPPTEKLCRRSGSLEAIGLFVNSFEIELPTIEADLYSIDPQPSGDKYSVLNSHTVDIEDTVGGKGRWYRRGDEYFIAIIGPDRREYAVLHEQRNRSD